MLTGVPWRTSDDDPDVNGEKLEVIKLTDQEAAAERDVMHETVP